MVSAALSFGAAARLYDAVRPCYPAAAVRWALGTRPLRVLDLGAGTGLLTRALRSIGHQVVCVEFEMCYRTCVFRMGPRWSPAGHRASQET